MSDTKQQQQQDEASRRQIETGAALASHKVGVQEQTQTISQRKNNPEFYEKYTESDLEESEKWGHLVNEYKAWLADDHVLSNRRQVFRLQAELLNQVRAEQSVAGATPGARLKEKPLLNALAQGIHPELNSVIPLNAPGQSTVDLSKYPGFTPPMDAEERTVHDDLASLATARHAMGVDSAGSEALTTVSTENRTVREDETESEAAGGISEVWR